MICEKCGAKLVETSGFCHSCGTPLTPGARAAVAEPVHTREGTAINPFKPPGYIREYRKFVESGGAGRVSQGYAKLLRVLAIISAFTVVGLVIAIPLWIAA